MSLGQTAIRLLLAAVAAGLAASAQAQDPGLISIPVDLEINGRGAGQVVLQARADLSDTAVQGASLKAAVAGRLTAAAAESISALPDGFVALDEARGRGIEIVLDVERLVLALKAAEIVRAAPPTLGAFSMDAPRRLQPELRLPEANLSGYVNIRVQDTLFAHGGDAEGDQAFSADIQSVLNFRGWALSANTLYSGRRRITGSHWTLGDVAVTHDIPEFALRWTLGDLAAPVGMLQSGSRLGGVSLSREFTIQPYENYQPTGTAAFQLQEAGTVEVYLNGVRMRTLKLEAGAYNLEDFTLAAGANDLELHITSASGRFEKISLSRFNARTLLRAGVSEFALSAGFPMAAPGDDVWSVGGDSWLAKHYERDPVASGFLRYGLSDTLTAEVNAQGAAYWQRAGAGFNFVSAAGAFEFHAAINRHADAGAGPSVAAAWERGFGRASLRISSAYTDAGFGQVVPEPAVPAPLAWNHAVVVSGQAPGGIDVTVSGYHQVMRDAPPTSGFLARFSRRFGAFLGSITVQGRRMGGGSEMSGFVTLSWMRPPEWTMRTVAGVGDASISPGVSTEASYTRRSGPRFVFVNAGVESDEEGDHYRGGVRYQDNRVLAELVHRQVYAGVFGQERRRAETVGTAEFALAWADGAWGLTRRVEDGFAVVTTHPRWRDVQLGINPAFEGYEHRVRPPFRSAVLGQLRAYRESSTFIQTVESDQVLENGDFVFFPTYRRGTRLVIGSDAVYTVRGTLLAADGGALGYRAIVAQPLGGGPEVSAFTNIAGRFVIGPIAAGRWRIRCVDSREWTEITVGGDQTFLRLDAVRLHPAD